MPKVIFLPIDDAGSPACEDAQRIGRSGRSTGAVVDEAVEQPLIFSSLAASFCAMKLDEQVYILDV